MNLHLNFWRFKNANLSFIIITHIPAMKTDVPKGQFFFPGALQPPGRGVFQRPVA